MVELYTAVKSRSVRGEEVSISFRVSPRFKLLLEAAAALERRSQNNMLETLLFAYCEEQCIEVANQKTDSELPTEGGAK